MKNVLIISILSLACIFRISAQQRITTVGIQVKPIFPVSFVNTGAETVIQNNVQYDITLSSGFSGGLMIRHGLSDLLAFEAGINYVKRKYDLKITDGDFVGTSEFRIIGYEIPLSLLVYIQLGEKFYMNSSLGLSLDMFASDVHTYDTYFQQRSFRNQPFQSAVIANLGWEYRTEKSGYIYIGASYHRPFNPIYSTKIEYQANGKDETVSTSLFGNYLTLDLRYFFYEDPKKNKKVNTDEE